MNDNVTSLEIICPKEPDMENTFDKQEVEDEIRELLEREPNENEWIEWVMFHDDVGDYFTDKLVEIVQMPEFKEGTFIIDGISFKFIKN